MNLQMFGCSYPECPLEIREQLTIPATRLPSYLRQFRARFSQTESVVLSTCNRTEWYTAASDESDAPTYDDFMSHLAEWHQVPASILRSVLVRRSGEDALQHLFAVASSLESLVLGELQIGSQVRRAYQTAQLQSSAGITTHLAFQRAMHVARRIARETKIHLHSVSIPVLAVKACAAQFLEGLADKQTLVLGAGEMALETLRGLRSEGANRITLANRDPGRAAALAQRFGAATVAWEQRFAKICTSDLVVSATGAIVPVVDLARYRAYDHLRRERTLLILDLGVPRDFDPAIAYTRGVSLYSIDDLRCTAEIHRQKREAELPRARTIVQEEVQRVMKLAASRSAVPAICTLIRSANDLRDHELDLIFGRLPNLSREQRREIRNAMTRLTNQLLHPLLLSLRAPSLSPTNDDTTLLQALECLLSDGRATMADVGTNAMAAGR